MLFGITISAISIVAIIAVIASIRYRKKLFVAHESIEQLEEERQIVMDFIHRSAEDISKGSDKEKIYRRIARATALSCGALSACVYERLPDGRLEPKAFEGLFPPQTNKIDSQNSTELRTKFIENALKREILGANEGIIGQAATERRGFLIEDALNDPRVPKHNDESMQIRTFIAVPMIFGKHLSGVLALANSISGKAFTKVDFSLANLIGEQGALALQSAEAIDALIMRNKLEFDLRLASSVQRYLLPEKLPMSKTMQFAAKYSPQQLIGGDFYDFFNLPNNKIGIVIGDVSGKGISAAILMALCQTKLRDIAKSCDSPAKALRLLNSEMVRAMRSDMFITMIYLIADSESGEIKLARAGHERPLLARLGTDEPAQEIKSSGMAVGMVTEELFDEVIEDVSFTMSIGDALVLYTDGLTEAVNANGEEYSTKRLAQTVSTLRSRCANDLNDEIIKSVSSFMSPNEKYSDDLTLLSIKKL